MPLKYVPGRISGFLRESSSAITVRKIQHALQPPTGTGCAQSCFGCSVAASHTVRHVGEGSSLADSS